MSFFPRKLRKDAAHIVPLIKERIRGVDFRAFEESEYPGANPYEMMDAGLLEKTIREEGIATDSVWLDVGCGKGYVLYVLHQLGYEAASGIEISEKLARVARRNMERLNIPARIIVADASSYEGYDPYNVFFLFNPFSQAAMESFLFRIRESWQRVPRSIRLVYANPRYHDTVEPYFSDFHAIPGKISGYDSCVAVYKHFRSRQF